MPKVVHDAEASNENLPGAAGGGAVVGGGVRACGTCSPEGCVEISVVMDGAHERSVRSRGSGGAVRSYTAADAF
jgi:hypothetical protein